MGQIHELIRAGDVRQLRRLLETHVDAEGLANERDAYGNSPLITALECPAPDPLIVRTLLTYGAQVWFDESHENTPLTEPEVIEIVRGIYPALPQDFFDVPYVPEVDDRQELHRFLGLDEFDFTVLDAFKLTDIGDTRFAKPGTANPEDQTTPYRIAMVQCGASPYTARERLGESYTQFAAKSLWVAFKELWSREEPTKPERFWTFCRYGQSLTIVPGGRRILIGGEYDDFYDPDFYIYNDVVVFHPDGEIQIFGYPHEVFEPTDFHTATLVGEHIWIVGGLGYKHQREGTISVYRLDLQTYRIERLTTTGDVPPRLYKHQAKLVEDSIIVREGQLSDKMVNVDTYELHVPSITWGRSVV